MNAKKIEQLLTRALLEEGEMQRALYESELEELLDEFRASMARDEEEFLFAITENDGNVAMVLLGRAGQGHINEEARGKLKALWPADAYESNLRKLIPTFARSLSQGELAVVGVETVEVPEHRIAV